MIFEQWEKYKPVAVLEKNYIIESISNSSGNYLDTVVLSSTSTNTDKIIIDFKTRILSFRRFNAQGKDQRLLELRTRGSLSQEGLFFLVNNSPYAKEIEQNSLAIFTADQLLHIAIVADNWLLEVITSGELNGISIIKST